MNATQSQIKILQHTLGIRVCQREPHRNHYVADVGHHAMPDLEALEVAGLMGRARTPSFCDQSDIVFCTTAAGRALAIANLPEPSKRTRYDEFLNEDGNLTFGEYLCGHRLPKYEHRGSSWCGSSEYKMFRRELCGGHTEGQWAKTKKDAKASYKAVLAAQRIENAKGDWNG